MSVNRRTNVMSYSAPSVISPEDGVCEQLRILRNERDSPIDPLKSLRYFPAIHGKLNAPRMIEVTHDLEERSLPASTFANERDLLSMYERKRKIVEMRLSIFLLCVREGEIFDPQFLPIFRQNMVREVLDAEIRSEFFGIHDQRRTLKHLAIFLTKLRG